MIFVRYYFWVAPHVLLGALLVITWLRGQHRRLPFFFVYGLFTVLQFVALFGLSRILPLTSLAVYHWTLAVSSVIQQALELGALFELAGALLLKRISLANTLRLLMKWTIGVLVLVAAAASASLAATGLHGAVRIFSVFDFCSSLIEVGLLLAVFLFSRALNISWRSWPTGVALGFGISACMNLGTAALRAGLGKPALIAVDIIQMAAFHAAVVVWVVYLFLPERQSAVAARNFGEAEINFWDQELRRMARQ